MKRSWMVSLALLVAVPAAPALAGAAPADSAARDSLAGLPVTAMAGIEAGAVAPAPRRMRDTVTVIKGLTVRGERRTTSGRESATTTRLDRAMIARFQPSTAADAMVAAPGVDLIKTGPWASKVSFRGFSGERVLVMVDGVRLNTGRGHGSNTSLVSVDRLDQVELVAGSGGAEYGSDAMGGVVNLVTHRPLFSSQPAATLTLAARGSTPGDGVSQTGRLRVTGRHLGLDVHGGLSRLDALVTPRGRVANSGNRDEDFGARARARLGESTLDYEYTRHAAHDVGLPGLNGSFPTISRGAHRFELASPFLASAFGWGVPANLRLLAVEQRYRTDFDERTVTEVLSPRTGRPIAYQYRADEDRVVTRSRGLQPELRLGQDGELRLGAEFRHERTSGPKTSTVTTQNSSGAVTGVTHAEVESVPHATRDVVAGSLASRVRWGVVRLEGGARYDHLRSRADSTESSWTPPLDAVDERWSMDGGLAVALGALEPYGRVASGFRAPNLEERYYRGPIHGVLDVFGNPDLVAERNVTYEAGVRANHDTWGSLRASAYRTHAEDFITLKYLLLVYGRPRFQYENLERAQVDGVELAGRTRIGRAALNLAVTLPRGRDLSTGARITEVGSSKVTLDVAAPVGNWLPTGLVAVRARWSDALASDPLAGDQSVLSRPAFWTVNAEFGVTLAGARATLAVRNLFDHAYREPLSYIDEPGRTVSLSLKRDFSLPVFASEVRP